MKNRIPRAVLITALLAQATVASAMNQDASRLVDQAEAEVAAGRPRRAWELFAQAWLADRSAAPPARGICRLALQMHEQKAAQAACQNAVLLGQTPEDMRNRVAAWVLGPVPPTMEELMSASFMAEGAVRMAPGQPWGYGARADLALRLGDRELLDSALADLRRIAPDHTETRRVQGLATAHGGVVARLGLWALVLLPAGTLIHALSRRWRRRGRAIAPALSAASMITVLLVTGPASAAPFPVDDTNPEASAPSVEAQFSDPLAFGDWLNDVIARAQKAERRGDYAAAARYYAALTKAVPQRSYGWGQLCDSLAQNGQWQDALAACRTALGREGVTAGDYTRFVTLLLARDGALDADLRRQAEIAIGQLEKEPRAIAEARRLRCRLLLHEHDGAVDACLTQLHALAPDAPTTVELEWARAIERHDVAGAERLAERAKSAGVSAGVVQKMGQVTRTLGPGRMARAGTWAMWAGGSFLLIALAYMVGTRRGTIHSITTRGEHR
jgi:hypothetical protein